MRHQIAFRQYNLKKPHRYGLLWKSLNDARFPYTYKSVHYAAKLQAGDGPHYIKDYQLCVIPSSGLGKTTVDQWQNNFYRLSIDKY